MGEKSILVAGIGGQGVVFAATTLAKALFLQDFHVAQLQSYGAEVRGGAVLAWVIYSESPVTCPFTDTYDLALFLHKAGLEEARRKGLQWRQAIVDEDLVRPTGPHIFKAYPIHRLAREAGLEGRENIVAIGILAGLGHVDPKALEEVLSTGRGNANNLKALELGMRVASHRF